MRRPRPKDFLVVLPDNLDEIRQRAMTQPFFLNGLLNPAGEGELIDINDVVVFPWRDVVEQLAELVEEDEDDA